MIIEEDLGERPYTADEQRVANYLVEHFGIGGGDDPVGFLMASHRMLSETAKEDQKLQDLGGA